MLIPLSLCICYLSRSYFYEVYNNLKFISNIYNIYREYPNINNNSIDNLTHSIDKLGIFAIKLVQWGLTRIKLYDQDLNNNFDKLEKYYEDCPKHDDSFTYKTLIKDYNVDFTKYYEFEVIASGSIAQVYKLTNKENKKNYALKIVHPNLKKKLKISKFLINSCIYLYKFISDKHLVFLDLSDFFTNIEKQLDLNQEYIYHNYFYENHKNKFIYVPKPLACSENTLIMEYVPGTKFDNTNISLYKKAKIIQNLKMFSLNCYFNQKYIHADLHNGNWKIRFNEKCNYYQIIIYDFGLCYDSKDFDMFKLREYLSEGKIDIMTNQVLHLLIDENIKRDSDLYKSYKDEFITTMKKNDYIETMDFTLVIPMVYKFTIDHNLKINGNLLLLLLLMVVNDNNVSKLKEKVAHKNNNLENYDYPRMIFYCKENDLYPDLKAHMEKYVEKNKTTQCLFNYIDEKYGMLNSDSDIYSEDDITDYD